MRAVIQRVDSASVRIGTEVYSSVDEGFLIYLGIEHADEDADILWLVDKIAKLRIFSDEEGKMNRTIQDVEGSVLVISQRKETDLLLLMLRVLNKLFRCTISLWTN